MAGADSAAPRTAAGFLDDSGAVCWAGRLAARAVASSLSARLCHSFDQQSPLDLIAQHFPDKLELTEEHFLSRQEQSFLLQLLEEEWQELLSAIRQTDAECWIVTDEVGLVLFRDQTRTLLP